MKKGLFEYLKEYSDSDFYPFHMPGHKRNTESGSLGEMYRYDFTEIEGFDNLHQPESIIRDAQMRAAELYHSEETYFLVNGSTVGLLSAVSAIAHRAGKLIIARNCHKAVYHAAFLNHMELSYVYPEVITDYDLAGEVSVKALEKVIKEILELSGAETEQADRVIAGVVITSPTYEGISSDVKGIAELVHGYGIPLIVDQAHGAHFGMHPAYPPNGVEEGADLVVHSVHKTLPAPTQTALLHKNGNLIDGERLRKYLRIYQSSSPSYLLMAGIDEAVKLTKEEGFERLDRMLLFRNCFLNEMKNCRHIRLCPLTEPGKLVLSVRGCSITGQKLNQLLRERYRLEMEMASGSYVVAIITMMDREEGFERLLHGLKEIDGEIAEGGKEDILSWTELRPELHLQMKEAYTMPYAEAELAEAEGKTAAEFVNLYPPGIPLLVPGEKIDMSCIEVIGFYIKNGYTVNGINKNKIKVVKPLK